MTVQEILALSPEERRNAYAVVNGKGSRSDIDMSSVWIKISNIEGDATDDFTENDRFTNYGEYSFVWQKSLKESPERTDDGGAAGIRKIPSFLTANLKINFSLLSIDDYRRIMKLIYRGDENCYKVKAYDIVYDRMVIVEMYIHPEEMPKVFAIADRVHGLGASQDEWTSIIGVQDYTVQVTGTGLDDVKGRYQF